MSNNLNKVATEQDAERMLSDREKRVRSEVNSTYCRIEKQLLYKGFVDYAVKYPESIAILWEEQGKVLSMTYGVLYESALRLAAYILKCGVCSQDNVTISIKRGPEQIIGVLGILFAGGIYVPVGINQPEARKQKIYEKGGIRFVLADTDRDVLFGDQRILNIKEAEKVMPASAPAGGTPDLMAYTIFTSGSAGTPKGVQITHGAAYNTIADLIERFSINKNDRCLAVSALDFDLSVFDIFAMLSVGGSLVLLSEDVQKEAAAWTELIYKTGITIWNSVPALLDMLLVTGAPDQLKSLRLVLVSGDWISIKLPGKLREKVPEARFIALGGATECSIWSNYFEVQTVNPDWKSIPYGRPLRNQVFRVVNEEGLDCPDMLPGELWIGGEGVAQGYAGDAALTHDRFVWYKNTRWYKTGDSGRYWPDGTIEFLGRLDNQIKLHGFRIELGEIEAILKKHTNAEAAVACVTENNGGQHLNAVLLLKNEMDYVQENKKNPVLYAGGSELKQQDILVEAFLTDLLHLFDAEHIEEGISFKKIAYLNSIIPENDELLNMWLEYLCKKQVLTKEADLYYKGYRHQEVSQYIKSFYMRDRQVVLNEQYIELEKRLHGKIHKFREMLAGEERNFILEDDILSPEKLTLIDAGTQKGLMLLQEKIRELYAKKQEKLKLGILGVRSGVVTELLLNGIDTKEVSITVFDSAKSMLLEAKNRLKQYSSEIKYEYLDGIGLREDLQYGFDVLIAVNSLHQYSDIKDGAAYIAQLVKHEGIIMALEHEALAPVGLVTAAVLEKGFVNLDPDRKKRRSPMLNMEEWACVIQKAGFSIINSVKIPESITNFICASHDDIKSFISLQEIKEKLKKELPVHMIPERIDVLFSMPLNANGKVDRRAIAERFRSQRIDDIEKPRNITEKIVAKMWCDLLQIEEIDRKSSFFEIGGDSLLATKFITLVHKHWDIQMALKALFDRPKLENIAGWIEEKIEEQRMLLAGMTEGEI